MKIDKRDWVWYEETDSTNLRAKEAGEQEKDISKGMLFVADRQTAGTGRRGRTWESPAGDNIYMSLLFKPEIEPAKAPMLTLVMAVAVAEGIRVACENTVCDNKEESCSNISAQTAMQIKWPNDIILNKKKVCGVLTEMALDGAAIKYVVIGVGINVNQKKFSEELEDKATSLAIEFSKEFDRKMIISSVLGEFLKYYDGFLRAGDLSYLQETYNTLLVNRDADVLIHEPGNEYRAHAVGINEQGELEVELLDGTRQNIYAGEVSVRGVYGYV